MLHRAYHSKARNLFSFPVSLPLRTELLSEFPFVQTINLKTGFKRS